MERNVLVATREGYMALKKSGVDISYIDDVQFITEKQERELVWNIEA